MASQDRGYCTIERELDIRLSAKRAGLNAFLTGANKAQLTALGRAYYEVFQNSPTPIKEVRKLASTMKEAR